MKLNTELKSIFSPLVSTIRSKYKRLDGKIDIYIKTPNIFYRKVVVYMKSQDGLIEITNELDMEEIKSMMAKAYINYFIHYNSTFNKPYYEVVFNKVGNDVKITEVIGSDSPDPIDKDGTKIRK